MIILNKASEPLKNKSRKRIRWFFFSQLFNMLWIQFNFNLILSKKKMYLDFNELGFKFFFLLS